MIQLTIQDIAAAEDRKIAFVPCPEFAPKGVAKPEEYGVYVMSLTVEERDEYEKSIAIEALRTKAKYGIYNMRSRFVARTLCDKDGNRMVTDRHWEMLCKKSSAAMSRIFDKAAELSGLSDNDLDEAVEVLKNGQTDEPGKT